MLWQQLKKLPVTTAFDLIHMVNIFTPSQPECAYHILWCSGKIHLQQPFGKKSDKDRTVITERERKFLFI
jgi:hypothetical protein